MLLDCAAVCVPGFSIKTPAAVSHLGHDYGLS